MKEKIPWHGVLISVQPRIRLSRSFDQRSHTYLGYTLTVRGSVGTEAGEFLLGVGQGAHAKHHFRAGDTVSGDELPVPDPFGRHRTTNRGQSQSGPQAGPRGQDAQKHGRSRHLVGYEHARVWRRARK